MDSGFLQGLFSKAMSGNMPQVPPGGNMPQMPSGPPMLPPPPAPTTPDVFQIGSAIKASSGPQGMTFTMDNAFVQDFLKNQLAQFFYNMFNSGNKMQQPRRSSPNAQSPGGKTQEGSQGQVPQR